MQCLLLVINFIIPVIPDHFTDGTWIPSIDIWKVRMANDSGRCTLDELN